MKLYDTQPAPNCRRVRVFLAEKDLEVPLEPVDLVAMENRKPPYSEKNPLSQVPMLELDDGTLITESVAICRYFEELHPDPPLMGVGATDAALVEMWNRRMEHEVLIPVMSIFRHGHEFFAERIEQVPEFSEASRRLAQKRLEWLEGELGEREFVAGTNFTIADITLMTGIDFGKVSKFRLGEEMTNLRRWYDAVSSRPSASA